MVNRILFLTFFFFILSGMMLGQEDCFNGIDDDGDGLIDIQDDNCECTVSTVLLDLGFEQKSCCPSDNNYNLSIDCLDEGWFTPTGSVDYFNTCGFMGNPGTPPPPTPFPSGSGVVGFATFTEILGGPFPFYESLSNCLDSPMTGGQQHEVSFEIGFGSDVTSLLDVTMGLYGKLDCTDLFSGDDNCLADNGWDLITEIDFSASSNDQWVFESETFTPNSDYAAIGIAITCGSYPDKMYHYIDDVLITGPGGPSVGDLSSSGNCIDGVTIELSDVDFSLDYQWYLDGVAVDGETSDIIVIEDATADGEYQVMVIDNGLCALSDPISIDIDDNTLVINELVEDVKCNGESTGSIDITTNSANTPLIFDWDSGASTAFIDGLPSGDYEVTVTDANGCFDIQTYTIEEPMSSIGGTLLSVVHPAAPVLLGSATVNATGGVGPYTFLWSNGEMTEMATSLPVGANTVVITDSNGCQTTLQLVIQEPLVADVQFTNDNCNLCEGTLDIIVTGGLPDYQITWEDGANNFSLVDLCASQYAFTVTDENGTQVTGLQSIEGTDPLAIQTIIYDENICNGTLSPLLETNVSGGSPPLAFEWSTGETASFLSDIGEGSYTLSVTDFNGCMTEETYTIVELLDIQISETLVEPDCNIGNNGSIDLTLNGGQQPYGFLWSNGSTTSSITDLSTGDYSVTITDAANCSKEAQFTLSNTTDLSVIPIITSASCALATDGSIALNVNGSSNPSFLWDDGSLNNVREGLAPGMYSVVVSDGSDCDLTFEYEVTADALFEFQSSQTDVICSGSQDGTIDLQAPDQETYTYVWSNGSSEANQSNLEAGSYSVVITNTAGCERSYDYEITYTEPLVFIPSIVNVPCNGEETGSISVAVLGGQGMISLSWNTNETTFQISNLAAQSYTLTARDELGCELTETFEVTSLPPLVIQEVIENAGCNGEATGSISLTIDGGSAPYDITWNTGDTTPEITGLTTGTYFVDITDANNCTIQQTFELTDFGTIDANIASQNISCFGQTDGSLTIDNLTGTSPYTIQINGEIANLENLNLGAGNYSINVVDDNGCIYEEEVTLTSPNELNVNLSKVDVLCFGELTGELSLMVSEGTGPYQVFINGELKAFENTELKAGDYNIQIIDANNCMVELNETITEPSVLSADILNISSINNSNTFGAASINVVGGTLPYDIQWSSGDTGASVSGLGMGIYAVTVTDVNGCQTIIEVTIEEHLLVADFSQVNNLCFGACEASIQIDIMEGDDMLSYDWSDGSTGQSQNGLCDGDYSCVVTDQFGNEITVEITVESPEQLVANSTVSPISCPGKNDGEISIEIAGGSAPYEILYGGNSFAGDGLAPGTYNITIQDSNGCLLEVVETVEDIVVPELVFNVSYPDCSQLGQIEILNSQEFSQNLILTNGGSSSALMDIEGDLSSGFYTVELDLGPDCIVPLEVIEIEENLGSEIEITEQEFTLSEGQSQALTIEDDIELTGNYEVTWEVESDYICTETDDYGNCIAIEFTPLSTTTVSANLINDMGCEQQFTFNINVEKVYTIFVPNIISANEDNTFKLYSQSDMTTLESFSVYSRWGVKLYEEQGILINNMTGWDLIFNGSNVDAGVYVYVAHFQHPSGQVESLAGDITVVR